MSLESFVSRLVDLAASSDIVEDYSLDVYGGSVLEARMELEEGFVDVYRNFETGKRAFAWIVNEKRVFGADNTGGWHKHPFDSPESHVETEAWSLEEFMEKVSELTEI